MELANWRRIGDGDEDEVLLAVGFSGPVAGFSDLADALAAPWAMYETVALPPLRRSPTEELRSADPEQYIHHWLTGVSDAALKVRAVISYCAGSSFVGTLTDAIVERGLGRPALVLIEPEMVTAQTLHWQFTVAAQSFYDYLDRSETSAVQAKAAAAADGPTHPDGAPGDLDQLGSVLSSCYHYLVRTYFERLDLRTPLEEELCSRFDTYVAYLIAAGKAQFACASATPTVIASYDHDVKVAADAVIRVAAGRATMLADPTVAQAVRETVEQHRR